MNDKPSLSRTAYAWQHRADLPGAPSKLDRTPEVAPRFAQGPVRSEGRGSVMVKTDRPHPAPRPAPHLALGPDRAAFIARWTRETEAANGEPESPERAARRATFKAKRQAAKQFSRARDHKRPITR